MQATRPSQVWAADIAYLPIRRGFLYVVAIMGWHTHKVLAWRISYTLEADFCVVALNEAIHRLGRSGGRISVDGKGRLLAFRHIATRCTAGQRINIFVKRHWRSLKCESVCPHA